MQDADVETLLLSLFARQAYELRVHLRSYGLDATDVEVAERVVDNAARHISRVQRERERLRSSLERLLTLH